MIKFDKIVFVANVMWETVPKFGCCAHVSVIALCFLLCNVWRLQHETLVLHLKGTSTPTNE